MLVIALRHSLTAGAAWAASALLFAPAAMAAQADGSMPWDSVITSIRNDITGPFASIAATLAMAGAGYGLMFRNEELSGWVKTLLGAVMAIALTVGAQNLISMFQGTGALVG